MMRCGTTSGINVDQGVMEKMQTVMEELHRHNETLQTIFLHLLR